MATTVISDPKLFGYWAYQAIEKHFHKTIKHESDVLKDKDPEALHQMRVGMRRLRTAVTGFEKALVLPKAAREKKIAKVARKLGKLRDLDVLQDALKNHYLPPLPIDEQKALKKVLATLKKQRQHSLEVVRTTLEEEGYQELKQGLKDWLEKPTYGAFAELAIQDILPDLLLPLVSQLCLHPAWLVGAKLQTGEIDVNGDLSGESLVKLLSHRAEELHDLRKQAKRVRYQMELFTEFYDSNYHDFITQIKSLQRILGNIQDSFVLSEFLADSLNVEIAVELPTLTEHLQADRYQSWQEWRQLQQQYLNPQTKKDFHYAVLQPINTN
ncbi:MAG TPA: metal-binding protein [Cyanobacteria bacterium UBA9273]|nr:metal-binding protein [Cyanobacteria bacterium UBA9273]